VRSREGLDRPDIQYHFAPIIFDAHGFEPPTLHGFTIGPTLVQPASRGRLALASADPRDKPHLDPRLLAEPSDMASLVAGLRIARTLAHTAPFEPWRGPETGPGEQAESGEALEAWVHVLPLSAGTPEAVLTASSILPSTVPASQEVLEKAFKLLITG
jgi:choline dehydrogenase-like flavoprotein